MSSSVKYNDFCFDPIVKINPSFSKKKIIKKFKGFDNYPGYLVVAIVLYRKSKYYGCNTYKTSPNAKKEINNIVHYSIHAEQAALSQLPNGVDYSKVKIFILRIPKFNKREYSLARPCIHCQETMKSLGIKPRNVFYTDNNSNWRSLSDYDN